MANYIVNSCLDPLQSYIVSASSLSEGEIIGFNSSEENFCGEVIESTESTHNAIYIDTFEDCCECLSAATTNDYASFKFINCETEEAIYVNLSTFCDTYGSNPRINEVFRFYNETNDGLICAAFNDGSVLSGTTFWIPDEGPYDNCFECGSTIIKTAGTPYEVCLVCCPCESGATITSISVPHPVWTDLYGNTVIQANAVQLGGANGLYS